MAGGRLTGLAVAAGACVIVGALLARGVSGCADTNYFNDSGVVTDVGTKPPTDGGLKGLKSIRLIPENAVLEIVNDTPAVQAFKAMGKFADDSERDITLSTDFTAENPVVGVFSGNTFKSGGERGGKTKVTADAGGITGTTDLTVVYKKRIFTAGVSPTVEQGFDKAKTSAGLAPNLAYPPESVMIPPNLVELEFQWTPASGTDLFAIRLANDGTDIRIYTKCTKAGSGCGYKPDEATWKAVIKTFKGADAARVSILATDAATMSYVGTSASRDMSVAEEDIIGGLYYWNATPGAIIRYDFGKVDQKAKLFYTAADAGAIFCVGCHAMSRDGKRMAVGLDMPMPAPLKVVDVASRKLLSSGAANFMTFSPDGEKLIASDGNSLGLYEAATLKPLATNPFIPKGTMPDWSPDGTRVVYAEPKSVIPFVGTPGINEGSLKIVAYDSTKNTFSGAITLVASSGDNNYYPTFSPDNTWIVYNRCTTCAPATSSSTGGSGSSYDSKDATLYILRADGKGKPMEMKLANGGTDRCNSWPKFSPFMQKYRGGKLMWVTFSSRRDYGLRLVGQNQAQIWMAAIDPAKAELTDPSQAAFWLPFQDIKTGNHIAQWAETVVRKPCTVKEDCPGGEFCDNGVCEPKPIE